MPAAIALLKNPAAKDRNIHRAEVSRACVPVIYRMPSVTRVALQINRVVPSVAERGQVSNHSRGKDAWDAADLWQKPIEEALTVRRFGVDLAREADIESDNVPGLEPFVHMHEPCQTAG